MARSSFVGATTWRCHTPWVSTVPRSKRFWLMVSLGTALSAVMMGCSSDPGGAPSPATCDYGELRVSPQGAVGATGHIGLSVLIENPTAETCELSGYPALRLLDDDDQLIGNVTQGQGFLTGTRAPVGIVAIAPQGQASFLVEWASVGAEDVPCTAGVRLGVILPGTTDELLIPARSVEGLAIAPCGGGLAVSPILPSHP